LAGRYNLFYPAQVDTGAVNSTSTVHWQKYDVNDFQIERMALRQIRAAEPIKGFLFKPRERVAKFPERLEPEPVKTPTLLFGVKGCDLRGILVHKQMFLAGEFADPFFAERLKNTALVGADCPAPQPSCFCNLLGLNPYVTEEVDISLTVLDDGWLIEVLSARGRDLIAGLKDGFQPAGSDLIQRREAQRATAVKILKKQNPQDWNPYLPKAIEERTKDTEFWQDGAEDCVECFGCLLTCPTCFCYLLYDAGNAERFERARVWDFCYIPMYARVGGGANPRPGFLQRFINRFHCKFMNFKNQHGVYACSGCGRCFTTCMGRIDIRKILGAL